MRFCAPRLDCILLQFSPGRFYSQHKAQKPHPAKASASQAPLQVDLSPSSRFGGNRWAPDHLANRKRPLGFYHAVGVTNATIAEARGCSLLPGELFGSYWGHLKRRIFGRIDSWAKTTHPGTLKANKHGHYTQFCPSRWHSNASMAAPRSFFRGTLVALLSFVGEPLPKFLWIRRYDGP